MLWLARKLALAVYVMLLKSMRTPWVRRMRHHPPLVPAHLQERARLSIARQDKFARKYGLAILTVSFAILIGSIVLSAMTYLVLQLTESGVFSVPDEIRDRTQSSSDR